MAARVPDPGRPAGAAPMPDRRRKGRLSGAAAALWLLAWPALAAAETIRVGDHEIWYDVTGEPANRTPPVLLLHGGMMNTGLAWSALIPVLANDRAVIGIDQQGHGHSPDHPGPITLDSMRADTLAVLDALQVGRVHVVGFSLGGMLGLDLAINAPDRVASLTAISASQNGAGMLPELVAMNRDPGHTPSPELVPLLPSAKDFLDMRRGYEEQNPDGSGVMVPVMAKLGALLSSDWGWSDEELAGITAPVMIVIGDRDFVLPDHAVHMARTIPDAWLTILPDTTHMQILAQPELPGLLARRMADTEPPE